MHLLVLLLCPTHQTYHIHFFSSFDLIHLLSSTISPGYFTNLLNRDNDDVSIFEENFGTENEVTESSTMNDLNSQTKSKGRSKNFNEVEDILLISSYLNISKDAVVGTDQKDGRFWERVEKNTFMRIRLLSQIEIGHR
jgi:hypothetical protein